MAVATTTVLAAAAVASAVGTGVAFYGQQQQAKAAEFTAKYNAELAAQQAEHETEVAAENARRKTRDAARILAMQREAIAASGLAPAGTPLAILGETVTTLERDVLDMGYAAAARSRQLESAARMGMWEGKTTAGALRTQSFATMASGLSSATTGYFKATGKEAPKKGA